jgi:5-methyltetrahydropteroyltriglutamate--homocysteine methyltransferase
MKRSSERILTTHTGSLPRPDELTEAISQMDQGTLSGEAAERLPGQIRDAVEDIVRSQIDSGVDIVGDGEMSKIGYATYVKERLTGFDGEQESTPAPSDLMQFPELGMRILGELTFAMPACTGPVEFRGEDDVATDLENLRAALNGSDVEDAFISAASPGVISVFLPNKHYSSEDEYLEALGEAMKPEYDAIHAAGFLLQLDCPDLAMGHHVAGMTNGVDAFRDRVRKRVEVLSHALRDIPEDRIRMHVCWGNYEGPHHHDVPIKDIIDLVLEARPQAISFEGANPRHEHEWRVFEEVELPEGKIIMPGVIDSTTNYIEHPELVADRIERYAGAVGRENVIASSDCGFATFATFAPVDPGVTWLKLKAMRDGAEIATKRLWG